jgi:transcriptional regulator with XRE-family HTH domain
MGGLTVSVRGITVHGVEALRGLIEEWLRANNSSQAELAQRSGVKQNVISRWLNRQVDDATPKNLKLIAPVLGLTYEELLRLMGELPASSPQSQIDARRQAVREQLERWMSAVGPENESVFWEHLKAQGEATVDLIRRVGTAVNADTEAADNAAVSSRAERGRGRRNGPSGQIMSKQHAVSEVLEHARHSTNRRQVA